MSDIAVVGIAGRFPGARNPEEFWRNLQGGVDSITRFADSQLRAHNAAGLASRANYVKARGVVEGAAEFDAAFFGMYPKEAEVTDPQQRVFLECCWEALESAGYDPLNFPGEVGVFAGSSPNTYFLEQLCTSRDFIRDYTGAYQVGNYTTLAGSNTDFLATRVAYKLNLKGPAFTMHCGCSTSLVAIVQACQNLLGFQCDAALAGGVSITFPQERGYLYDSGGMVSPDGHCRTFSEDSQGTVFGSGAAVVLLKRLDDALAGGDFIYAVIRGAAINNDGSAKAGFAAPGVEGQANVIAAAQAVARVSPESVTYIEAHGTATPLGDPIEVAALTKAFRRHTSARNFCALGTAKTNVGHLDVASGATGLVKVCLMLRDRKIPPLLHFTRPNPALELESSPFYINTGLIGWERGKSPRRAGVSAFGVGGTNAHVVLEEAPERPAGTSRLATHLLLLSARSNASLDQATANLAVHLKQTSDPLSDIAYTLQAGRHGFEHRRMLVASTTDDAALTLASGDVRRIVSAPRDATARTVAFLLPGQGTQHVNMARDLYDLEPVFRDAVDQCASILRPNLGFSLADLIYPSEANSAAAERELKETVHAQPAIFTIEYALARLWMSWGIKPAAMLGHSIGEYVAACLAGVFSLKDALGLIAYRGRLMQDLPGGAMLSVRLPAGKVATYLRDGLSVAAVNSPSLCVVSGSREEVAALSSRLERDGVPSKLLHTSHAFHSSMMDSILGPFSEAAGRVRRQPPAIPFLSSVTGTWITPEEAMDAEYWARHLRHTVQFSSGVEALGAAGPGILLEVGPGTTLSTLARQHFGPESPHKVIASLPDAGSGSSAIAAIQNAQGRLWLAGVEPDWKAIHANEKRNRVVLPTYPFERKRYWREIEEVEPQPSEKKPHEPQIADQPTSDAMRRIMATQIDAMRHLIAQQLNLLALDPPASPVRQDVLTGS